MAFGNQVADGANIPASNAYLPGTGFKVIRGGRIYTDGSGNDSVAVAMALEDGAKPTYDVSLLGITPVATPTDWIVLPGSATKVVRVVRVMLGGIATSAGGISWQLVKRSAVNTGGTSAAMTIQQHDTSDAAASAAPVRYTANATGLGAGNNVRQGRLFLNLATAQTDRVEVDFGDGPFEAVVLRGTAQTFAINLNSSTLPAGTALDVTLVWTEE
jgi:hypothetical protein